MRHFRPTPWLTLGLSSLLALSAQAKPAAGRHAPPPPDFLVAPGMLNGRNFSPDVKPAHPVVFVFFCTACPHARESLQKLDALYPRHARSRVRIVAVGSGVNAATLDAYFTANGIHNLEGLADPIGIMQHQLGFKISLNNIWQMAVLTTEGKSARLPGTLEDFLKRQAELQNTPAAAAPAGANPKLKDAYRLLAQGQPGSALARFRARAGDKSGREPDLVQEAQAMVVKLEKEPRTRLAGYRSHLADQTAADYFEARELLAQWKDDAVIGKEIKAFVDEWGAKQGVRDELAARRMRAQVVARITATGNTLALSKKYFAVIAQKYPDTPTGRQAAHLAHLK